MGPNKAYLKNIVLALGTVFLAVGVFVSRASASTIDYYKCADRVGGEYNYGRAPQACNANSFGEDKLVVSTYAPLIFDDNGKASERSRYVDEMNAVIKEAASYYLKKRKPVVSSAELSWWSLGIQATASHESYWTHYRKASDARLKMMRGDYGHGHGMMQIDDRSHFSVIDSGIAWNLISNLTYAMDIFYKNWEKASSQPCVSSATDYEARIRSAWAAYNGGSAKLCRWTNPNDKWAANDKNFYLHLSKRLWEKHATNLNKKASIDVACLIEKKENCPSPGGGVGLPTLKGGVLYQSSSGHYCVVSNNKAFCVAEFRDAICLKTLSFYNSPQVSPVSDSTLAVYAPTTLDRHSLCSQYDGSLFPVGSSAELQKNTHLRASPGGGVLAVIPKSQMLTLLDFEVRNDPSNDRYYKVSFQEKEGYVYAGNKTDYQSWLLLNNSQTLPSSLAKSGDFIQILNPAGINHRTTPGGSFIRLIAKDTQLQVIEVFVEGTSNKVYYKVSYQGQLGYIYTGLLLPSDSTGEWTQVLR